MKKSILTLMAAALLAPSFAMAEAGDIVVRLRATNIAPDEHSKLGQKTDQSYGAGTAALLYGNTNANLKVDNNTIPEVDFSYYITKNLAAELILALGTRHDVKTSSTGAALNKTGLGSVNLLPPTLNLQWHFLPDQTFDPYLGAGLTFVRSLDRNLAASTTLGSKKIHIDSDMWGPALQLGFDVNLDNRWLVNFDVKKIWVDTDVKIKVPELKAGYQKIDSLDLNPWVVSVGIGKKF